MGRITLKRALYRGGLSYQNTRFQSTIIPKNSHPIYKIQILFYNILANFDFKCYCREVSLYWYADFNESKIPKYSLCGSIYKIQIPSTKILPFSVIYKIQFLGVQDPLKGPLKTLNIVIPKEAEYAKSAGLDGHVRRKCQMSSEVVKCLAELEYISRTLKKDGCCHANPFFFWYDND